MSPDTERVGIKVWWCEQHRSTSPSPDERCRFVLRLLLTGSREGAISYCRMVEKRLVPPVQVGEPGQ